MECFHLSKKSDLGEKIRDIIQQVFKIKYVGSIVQNDRKINDVTHWWGCRKTMSKVKKKDKFIKYHMQNNIYVCVCVCVCVKNSKDRVSKWCRYKKLYITN